MAAAAKKKAEEEKRVILGRPGNNVVMGIVGMPNVGKSTIFNVLGSMNVPAENYPFCTIDPNIAKVPVPDPRFDHLCEVHKPKSKVPAVLTIMDIAGLVKGAHEGKGLGSAFLSHIYAVDGIFHLVRAFKNAEIEHVEGSVDPVRDLEIISNELRLKDLERGEAEMTKLTQIVARGIDKTKKFDLEVVTKSVEVLKAQKDIRAADWAPKEIEVLNRMLYLSAKPVVYLVNIGEEEYNKQANKWLPKIAEWVKKNSPGSPVLPFSAEFERRVANMSPEERTAFAAEHKEDKGFQPKIGKIITTGYHALDLIHFFTAGEDEVRAWTIRAGTKAPQAAGVIHTDFERGFICAETMKYADFQEHGSEAACKAAGKYHQEGKLYEVVDGDIMFFKFNVTAGGKKK